MSILVHLDRVSDATLIGGFAALWLLVELAERVGRWWSVRQTTKADRALLADLRVLAPVAQAIAENRAKLAVVRGDARRAAGKGDARVKPRRRSSRMRVLKLHAR